MRALVPATYQIVSKQQPATAGNGRGEQHIPGWLGRGCSGILLSWSAQADVTGAMSAHEDALQPDCRPN